MELFRTNLHLLEDQQTGSLGSGQQEVVGPVPAHHHHQHQQQQQFVSPACSVLPSNINNNSLHYQHHQHFPAPGQQQILKQYQVYTAHNTQTTAPIPQPAPGPAPAPMVISKLKASPTLISLQSARDHKFMPY